MLKAFSESLRKTHPKVAKHFSLAMSMSGIATSTLTMGPVIWVTGMPTLVLPMTSKSSRFLDKINFQIAERWLKINNRLIDELLPHVEWVIDAPENLSESKRYLMTSNHQTWVDTTVFQYVFTDRMPFGRFFTKFELIYVPFVGQAFKFLGFPMMKRHAPEKVAKNPKLALQDTQEAQNACARMKLGPYTLINFLEGTRFNQKKHDNQNSPYTYLLKPKYKGLALSFAALGDDVDEFLDLNIVYQGGAPEYLDFWRGTTPKILVQMRSIEIPDWVRSVDYVGNEAHKQAFKDWVDQIWQDKDARLAAMHESLS